MCLSSQARCHYFPLSSRPVPLLSAGLMLKMAIKDMFRSSVVAQQCSVHSVRCQPGLYGSRTLICSALRGRWINSPNVCWSQVSINALDNNSMGIQPSDLERKEMPQCCTENEEERGRRGRRGREMRKWKKAECKRGARMKTSFSYLSWQMTSSVENKQLSLE